MTVAALVADSLACLAAEHPAGHARMRAALADRRINARIGDEDIAIALDDHATTDVRVRTDVETLCAMLHGEIEVIDAVLADRVDVVGSPEDLVALADAMTSFIEGALRCVSIKDLADRLASLRKEHRRG